MGKKSKDKGYRLEAKYAAALRNLGLKATRVPLSGAASDYPGDIRIELDGQTVWLVEVKGRKNGAGFTLLERWIDGNDVLLLHRDYRPALVVLTWDNFVDLLVRAGLANHTKPCDPFLS